MLDQSVARSILTDHLGHSDRFGSKLFTFCSSRIKKVLKRTEEPKDGEVSSMNTLHEHWQTLERESNQRERESEGKRGQTQRLFASPASLIIHPARCSATVTVAGSIRYCSGSTDWPEVTSESIRCASFFVCKANDFSEADRFVRRRAHRSPEIHTV